MLTRRRIIAAAMALIESEGPQAVSMTRLATELGCGLVALYSYLPSMPALLDGIAGAIVSGAAALPQAGTAVPGSDWPDQLRAQAQCLRAAARAYPRCAIAVAGRAPASAAMLRPAEATLATLHGAGVAGPDAVRVVRVLAAFLAGSLLREAGVAPGLRAGERTGCVRPRLRAADFPEITSLTAELTAADPDGDFELGLDLLIRGLAGLLSGSDPRTASPGARGRQPGPGARQR